MMNLTPYFVYILKCSDNSYYTGVTNNLERRLYEHEHSTDPDSYTFNKRPLTLVFYEAFQDINQAIAFEKKVKGWTRKKKEALIERNWDKLKELAICRNFTSHVYHNKDNRTPFDYAQGDIIESLN
jgi:putative endonuclease